MLFKEFTLDSNVAISKHNKVCICRLISNNILKGSLLHFFVLFSLVHLHLQRGHVYASQVWFVRVSRMGHGECLAVDDVIFVTNSFCDDLQVDEYQWYYFRGKQRFT